MRRDDDARVVPRIPARQPGGAPAVVVDRLEEDRSAVGALLRGVEGCDQGLGEQRGEQHRLHSLFGHSRPSSVGATCCPHREDH
jgi:hypothetical protein